MRSDGIANSNRKGGGGRFGSVAARLVVLSAACALLPGCDLPRDPDGSFERARGGMLRAGCTANPPWVVSDDSMDNDAGRPRGLEPRLLEEFASQIGSRLLWRHGSESELVEALEDGERHVMLVRLGENRLLLELDRFLQPRRSNISPEANASLSQQR